MGQVDCQALSRVLLDQRQHLERWTIVHTEMYEVKAPDLIAMTRPQANHHSATVDGVSTAFSGLSSLHDVTCVRCVYGSPANLFAVTSQRFADGRNDPAVPPTQSSPGPGEVRHREHLPWESLWLRQRLKSGSRLGRIRGIR